MQIVIGIALPVLLLLVWLIYRIGHFVGYRRARRRFQPELNRLSRDAYRRAERIRPPPDEPPAIDAAPARRGLLRWRRG